MSEVTPAPTPVVDPGQGSPKPDGEPTQPPPGGSDDPKPDAPKEKLYPEAQFKGVAAQRDAAKNANRQLTARIVEMEQQLKVAPDAEALEAFNAWKAETEDQKRAKAIKSGDAQALEDAARKPLAQDNEALTSKNDALKTQLTGLLKTSALKSAAAVAGAINPDQIVMLLGHRVTMEERDGQFAPVFLEADGKTPMFAGNDRIHDADTFVRTYLALPENENLLKPNTTAGSGAKKAAGSSTSTDMPTTLEEFNALPQEKRREVAQAMTPEQRSTICGTAPAKQAGMI